MFITTLISSSRKENGLNTSLEEEHALLNKRSKSFGVRIDLGLNHTALPFANYLTVSTLISI